MATKKHVAENTELVAVNENNYLALQCEANEMREMIGEYLDDGLQDGDLEVVKVPTGGGLQWELPGAEGGEMESTFDGVIVGVQVVRSYWPGEFSGENNPPQCSSRDGKHGVGNPGGECEICPLNEWGSGKNGVGTACRERKRIYILRPNSYLPLVLSLPVTSIKHVRKYQIRLLNQRLPLHGVVTRFGLERTKSATGISYSEVTFTAAGPLPADIAPLAKAYANTIKGALGMQVREATEPPPPIDLSDDAEIPVSDPPFGGQFSAKQDDEIPF